MRNRILVGVILFVLGAMTTVAVAWIGAATTNSGGGVPLEQYARISAARHWTVHRWNRVTSTRIISRSWRGDGSGPYREGRPEFLLAGWGRIEPPNAASTGTITQLDVAWGFPLRALAGNFIVIDAVETGIVVSNAYLLPIGKAGNGGRPRSLPLRPLWWGLAVNTVIFALLALVVFAVVRDVTRLATRRLRPVVAAGERSGSPYTS